MHKLISRHVHNGSIQQGLSFVLTVTYITFKLTRLFS